VRPPLAVLRLNLAGCSTDRPASPHLAKRLTASRPESRRGDVEEVASRVRPRRVVATLGAALVGKPSALRP
jgi:hypothetical protein